MQLKTIYASIGNSDDKLSQSVWSNFTQAFYDAIMPCADQIHGVWFSEPSAPFQNMCVCFEISEGAERELRGQLLTLRHDFLQDSIAWAEVPRMEFL
jgi:hypothetical protein